MSLYINILIKSNQKKPIRKHICASYHIFSCDINYVFSPSVSLHEVIKDGTQLHLVVTNGDVEKDKINDLPLLLSLWALFLPLIHSLFMSGIVNLTSEQKGEGKDLGKVTTPFKFRGHWQIILLLSLQVKSTWDQKMSSFSLTYLLWSMNTESQILACADLLLRKAVLVHKALGTDRS